MHLTWRKVLLGEEQEIAYQNLWQVGEYEQRYRMS